MGKVLKLLKQIDPLGINRPMPQRPQPRLAEPKLKPCPDCEREVSTSAMNCPHCGRKLKQSAVGVAAAIFLIALLIAVLWILSHL
jgi:hypothetical protein